MCEFVCECMCARVCARVCLSVCLCVSTDPEEVRWLTLRFCIIPMRQDFSLNMKHTILPCLAGQ